MGYTVEELDEAIQGEETLWEGSWDEFEASLHDTSEWREVPEGTEGAWYFKFSHTWGKEFKLDRPGVDLPGIGHATPVEGGGEGDCWFVFKVTDAEGGERLFRRLGTVDDPEDGDTEEVAEAVEAVKVYKAIR